MYYLDCHINCNFPRDELPYLPGQDDFTHWSDCTLKGFQAYSGIVFEKAVVDIAIVDEAEIKRLNTRYRQRVKSTNTLSFSYDVPSQASPYVYGEIVLCGAIINREAVEQGRPANAHWAYITVHSVLHLCGLDHIQAKEAADMEALEEDVLLNRLHLYG